MDPNEVDAILKRARQAAIDYYQLARKPLGITWEYGAAERLGSDWLGLGQLATMQLTSQDAVYRSKPQAFHVKRSSSANAPVQLDSTTNGTLPGN